MSDLKDWVYRGIKIKPAHNKPGMNWKAHFSGGIMYFTTKNSVRKNLSRYKVRRYHENSVV